ncbi:MAG: hypothetical protein ABFS22_07435 [Pseudomonadota bacterium]
MNDTTTQTEQPEKFSGVQDKFIHATATASALFDLIAETASNGDVESLHKSTLTNAGLVGFEAVQDAKDAFNDLCSLYADVRKAQEVQS